MGLHSAATPRRITWRRILHYLSNLRFGAGPAFWFDSLNGRRGRTQGQSEHQPENHQLAEQRNLYGLHKALGCRLMAKL